MEAYPTERKATILKNCIGSEGNRIIKGMNCLDHKIEEIDRAIQEYYEGKKNLTMSRCKLLNRSQKRGESLNAFLISLQEIAKECSLKDEEKAWVRIFFINGLLDKVSRQTLIEQNLENLDEVIKFARQMEKDKTNDIGQVDVDRPPTKKLKEGYIHGKQLNVMKDLKEINIKKEEQMCKRCGKFHANNRRSCPAQGKLCDYCKNRHHFARCCIKKINDEKRSKRME